MGGIQMYNSQLGRQYASIMHITHSRDILVKYVKSATLHLKAVETPGPKYLLVPAHPAFSIFGPDFHTMLVIEALT